MQLKWKTFVQAFQEAESQLPSCGTVPKKPWISRTTVNLIQQRADARSSGDYIEEKLLHKAIRRSVRSDKAAWLDDLATRAKARTIEGLARGVGWQ